MMINGESQSAKLSKMRFAILMMCEYILLHAEIAKFTIYKLRIEHSFGGRLLSRRRDKVSSTISWINLLA